MQSTKHLGNIIMTTSNGMEQDALEKEWLISARIMELLQEFHFAHASTLVNVNNICSTHFYGSTLRNLYGTEVQKREKLWNMSQRKIYRLHRKTHKYLIEPVTDTRHIIFSFYKHFIKFINNISSSKKSSMKEILECIK